MTEPDRRFAFASDNSAGVCPEVLRAIEQANVGTSDSYGEDDWTRQVRDQVRDLFETDCSAFFVSNGTAANALALAQLCESFHSIVCHETAHIQTDECGAPEFFTKGSKLLLVRGPNGKINLDDAEAVIARQPELHAHKPRLVSITQATELGTVYRRDEIATVNEFARQRNLLVHMDGARLANAIVTLGCAPKEITWQAGVDVLCFGGTKNGLAGAELIVFFKKELGVDFDYRLKQAGQLQSKTRFLAAQWSALLADNLWLRNARHANKTAQSLAAQLQSKAKVEVVFPVEANSVFVRLEKRIEIRLRERGWHFYLFIAPDIYRLICAWSAESADVERFVADVICID